MALESEASERMASPAGILLERSQSRRSKRVATTSCTHPICPEHRRPSRAYHPEPNVDSVELMSPGGSSAYSARQHFAQHNVDRPWVGVGRLRPVVLVG